jgi:hypothetical protein
MNRIILITIAIFLLTVTAKSENVDCSMYKETSAVDKFKESKSLLSLFKNNTSKKNLECKEELSTKKLNIKKIDITLKALQNLEKKYNAVWNDEINKFTGPGEVLANKNGKNLINKRIKYLASREKKDCSKYQKISNTNGLKVAKTLTDINRKNNNKLAYKKCLNDSKTSKNMMSILKDKTSKLSKFKNSKSLNTYLKDGEEEKESTLSKFKKSKTWSDWKKNKNKDN